MKRTQLFLVLLGMLLLGYQPASAQGNAPLALVMTMDGPITPAMFQYLDRSLLTAEQRGAEVLILQLNTPGGDSQTRKSVV